MGQRNLEHRLRSDEVDLDQAIHWCRQVASTVAAIESAGYRWRDCKPRNFVLSDLGELRPVDFEGAIARDSNDLETWGTAGYTPRRATDYRFQDSLALLRSVVQILSEEPSTSFGSPSKVRMRTDLPQSIRRTVRLLDWRAPPSEVASQLDDALGESN